MNRGDVPQREQLDVERTRKRAREVKDALTEAGAGRLYADTITGTARHRPALGCPA